MKHAGPEALAAVGDLLEAVRRVPAPLTERKLGVFYFRSRTFLHFHEDPVGIFADLRRAAGGWERFAVGAALR